MSVLDQTEEEIFNKPAIYEKEKVNLILSNVRLVIAKKKTIIKDINYHLIEKIKYTKKEEPNPDEKTTAKFRILDAQENKIDISFKGVKSIDDLNTAVKILKQKKDEANNENYREQESSSSEHRSRGDHHFEGYLYAKGNTPSENVFKAKIFKQNPNVYNVYDHLAKQNIKNDELFWVNFKSQLANQFSLEEYQQSGYSGRFLSEVVADDTRSRGNQFSFTLNDNIRRQIMRKKPRVAERFISFLKEKEKPSKKDEEPMSKEDAENYFWQQYFAAGLRDASLSKPKREKDKNNLFEGIPLKDTVCFNENSRMKRAKVLELPVRVGSLYESINPLGNASYGCGCGQGIFNKELLPQLFQGTVDSYNIHSELSLIDNKILPDTTREIKEINEKEEQNQLENHLYIAPELDDLKPIKDTNLHTLKIVNALAKPPPEEIDPRKFNQEARHFADMIFDFNDNFDKLPSPTQPQMRESVIVLRDMTGESSNFYNYNKINSQRPQIYSDLGKVRNHKIKEQILLFLFWSNYLSPIVDQEKVEKIRDELKAFKNELSLEKRGLVNDESSVALPPLYEEMEDSINQILKLFNEGNNAQQVNAIPTNLDDFQFI